jgi:hypothetical protein
MANGWAAMSGIQEVQGKVRIFSFSRSMSVTIFGYAVLSRCAARFVLWFRLQENIRQRSHVPDNSAAGFALIPKSACS